MDMQLAVCAAIDVLSLNDGGEMTSTVPAQLSRSWRTVINKETFRGGHEEHCAARVEGKLVHLIVELL